MAKSIQVEELCNNPVWQEFRSRLETRLEIDRLALENLNLSVEELRMQQGVVAALRQVLYFIKELTENTDLKESGDGQ